MQKATAITLLGGTEANASRLIGCTLQAVRAWPDPLPRRISDRVLAARLRLEWRIALAQAQPGQLNELSPVVADALVP